MGAGHRWHARSDDGRPRDRREVYETLFKQRADGPVRSIDLNIQAIPRRVQVELQSARLVSGNIVHAGDTVTVEATVRPWQQPSHNVRIPVTLPARLEAGSVRILVSDGSVLDRTLDQPRMTPHSPDIETVLSQARDGHR